MTRPAKLAAICLVGGALFLGACFRIVTVDDASMQPSLRPSDQVVMNRWVFVTRLPYRGEIVRLRHEGRDRLARVVGIGGDTVEMRGERLYVGGAPVIETYARFSRTSPTDVAATQRPSGRWHIPGGCVFVLCDTRADTDDSRRFGPLPISDLEGTAVFLGAPLDRRRWL